MKKLAIIGSGDLGRLIAYYAIQDNQFQVVGFFDDYAKTGGIGYKHLDFRENLFNQLQDKIDFANLIHSSCHLDASCNIGKGIFMLPDSVLDHNVTIENNVVVNLSTTIAHDSLIGAHSLISPKVAIAGFVTIGKRCNIGINSTIIDNINITDGVQTGGGTVVIENLIRKGLYVGNPSRFIR